MSPPPPPRALLEARAACGPRGGTSVILVCSYLRLLYDPPGDGGPQGRTDFRSAVPWGLCARGPRREKLMKARSCPSGLGPQRVNTGVKRSSSCYLCTFCTKPHPERLRRSASMETQAPRGKKNRKNKKTYCCVR